MKVQLCFMLAGTLLVAAGCGGSRLGDDVKTTWQEAGELLGTAVREAGAERVVVITNPFAEHRGAPDSVAAMQKAGLKGLRRGLGKGIEMKEIPLPLPDRFLENPGRAPIPPGATTPLSYMMEPDAFSSLAPDGDANTVLVSMVGLPAEADTTPGWRDERSAPWALLFPDLGVLERPAAALDALVGGRIVAAVMPPAEPDNGECRVVTAANKDGFRQALDQGNSPTRTR